MNKKSIFIQPLGFEHPVETAASELAGYLAGIAPVKAVLLDARSKAGEPFAQGPNVRLVLGTSEHMKGLGLGRLPRMSDVDDALAIIPKDGNLYLAGSNARSVLFAAYRLLEEIGVVFLRPGPGGEVLPRVKSLRLPGRAIREKASYRHRGICIEGAPRLEHVLEMLDWMAKKKMNTFQLQFRHAGVFWRRGMKSPEMDNAVREAGLSDADCIALDERVIQKVKALGMVLHRVGHGWTSSALGFAGNDCEKAGTRVVPGKKSWPASVAGKRTLFMGAPSLTELCCSNLQVREAFAEEVLGYARQHSEVDVLHVWLSDAANNKCECGPCRKKSPTDWYVAIINTIGRRLKNEGLRTRIVFLAYIDLIYPPEKTRIEADNVIFMYAPARRCFRHALGDSRCDEHFEYAAVALNKFSDPRTNRPYARFARAWKRLDLPDAFLFDYHMMWDVWSDGFGKDIGSVMAQDIKDLKQFGFNGLISVQSVRAFYPMPYLPNAMADTLWKKELPAASHREKIMKAAFGGYAKEAETYFTLVIGLFRTGDDYDHKTLLNSDYGERERNLPKAAVLAGECRKHFKAASKKEKDPVLRTSLGLLAVHAEHAETITRLLSAGMRGDKERIEKMRAGYRRRLRHILAGYAPWIDPMVSLPVDVSNVHPSLVGVMSDAVRRVF